MSLSWRLARSLAHLCCWRSRWTKWRPPWVTVLRLQLRGGILQEERRRHASPLGEERGSLRLKERGNDGECEETIETKGSEGRGAGRHRGQMQGTPK